MGSAQFVYVVTYVEPLQRPVNKMDKNIHDKVAHFRLEFGTIQLSIRHRTLKCSKPICLMFAHSIILSTQRFHHNLITNYNLGFGNHCFFIRKQCTLTLSYNISMAIFKHQIKQSTEIK